MKRLNWTVLQLHRLGRVWMYTYYKKHEFKGRKKNLHFFVLTLYENNMDSFSVIRCNKFISVQL